MGAGPDDAFIALEQVSKDYSGAFALQELSLEVARGETLCLVGASGSGKTTALRCINRLVEPSAGVVRVGGEDVAGLDPIELRRRCGYVIQSGGLFPHLTVAGNIGLLCRLVGQSADAIEARVFELLALVQLEPEHAARHPAELSGGQRQRVGVARALALDPEILLMDEPFGALDPITRDGLQGEFAELAERASKTTVIVTHDLAEAFRLGDRVALLSEGRLVQVGTEAQLREDPRDDYVRRFLAGVQL